MRPGVGADGVALCRDLLQDLGMPGRMLADGEEDRLSAVLIERGEHGGGRAGPGAVVEGQHDLAVPEEIVLVEVLDTESRTAGGVDLDSADDADCIRVRTRLGDGEPDIATTSAIQRRHGQPQSTSHDVFLSQSEFRDTYLTSSLSAAMQCSAICA